MFIPGSSYRRGPRPYATIGLIIANVIVYIYTSYQNFLLESTPQAVYSLGFTPYLLLANPRVGVLRIFTSMFTHADILHIFFNMYFLYLFGYSVENYLGRARYLTLYFASGVSASLFHLAFSSVSDWSLLITPAVGASGAISGVLGAYLILFPNTKMSMCTIIILIPLCFPITAYAFMILWFALQVIYGYFTSTTIATFAHVGGFLTGILLTWLVARTATLETRQTTGMSLPEILGSLGIVFKGRRGLGKWAKGILIALIIAVLLGYSYGALNTVAQSPSAYIVNVNANDQSDQLLMVVYSGSVYITTSQVDAVRILVNRLQDVFFYDKTGANSVRNLQETYMTTVSGVIVPVELNAEVKYDQTGILESASGVMVSRVVNVNPYTGASTIGPSIRITFSMGSSAISGFYTVALLDVFASAISALTIIAVLKAEEASALGEEISQLPFI
jgi:membrane associated rhomboid family serine protease